MKAYSFITGLIVIVVSTYVMQDNPWSPWEMDDKGDYYYREVIQVDGMTTEELHKKSRVWFAETFIDSKVVLEIDEVQDGLLLGKGRLPFVIRYGMMDRPHFIHAIIKVESRDGRARFSIEGINIENENGIIRHPSQVKPSITMAKGYVERVIEGSLQTVGQLTAKYRSSLTEDKEDW